MDIDRVRYFIAIADTGSLVKASEVLNVSQPALSKALKVLESEVGVKLMESAGRGLRLTKSGIRFRDEVRPLFIQWQNLARSIHAHDQIRATKIASFEVFTTYFLGHLFRFGDLDNLEIYEMGPGRMEQAVADGRVDLAITYVPVPTADIEFVEIAKVRMGVFGLNRFESTAFAELPFVVPVQPVEGTPSKVIGLDGWPDHLFERAIKYRVTMMESALELCRGGHAVAYLPEFVVHLHNRRLLAEFRLAETECPVAKKDRNQSVYLVRKQGAKESSLERLIAKGLRSLK